MDATDAVVQYAFRRGVGWQSDLISQLTGYFTHIDCVFPDGTFWGARSDRIPYKGTRLKAGVQGRPADYEVCPHLTVFDIACTTLQRESVYAFFKSQEDKPYDWLAIVKNFGLGRNWRTPDHWFCSELGAGAGESADLWGLVDVAGGRKLFVPDNGVSPGMLAMLVSGLTGTQIARSY